MTVERLEALLVKYHDMEQSIVLFAIPSQNSPTIYVAGLTPIGLAHIENKNIEFMGLVESIKTMFEYGKEVALAESN